MITCNYFSDTLFPYRSPSPWPHPDPTPTPRNGPKTDPKGSETEPNVPKTDPKGSETEPNGPETDRNGAEMDRNQALWGGTAGGFVVMGGVWVVREKTITKLFLLSGINFLEITIAITFLGVGCKGKRQSVNYFCYRESIFWRLQLQLRFLVWVVREKDNH